MRKPALCIDAGIIRARERDGWINNDVRLRPDPVNDPSVSFPFILLQAGCRIIGMDMNDGSARIGRSQTVCDDLVDGHRNAGLPLAPPWSIQRRFYPDVIHRVTSAPAKSGQIDALQLVLRDLDW